MNGWAKGGQKCARKRGKRIGTNIDTIDTVKRRKKGGYIEAEIGVNLVDIR